MRYDFVLLIQAHKQMDQLIGNSDRLLQQVTMKFSRELLNRIDWDAPLIEIRGSRGVGKTTLLLQRAKILKNQGEKVLYASLDTPYFFTHSLYETAEQASFYGIKYLFLDEVHRYPAKFQNSDWSLEIKNVHDVFPQLQLVFSGSSILHLYQGKGDLSRRKATYLLPGLSFREYLNFQGVLEIPPLALEQLVAHHKEIAEGILQQIKPLPYFKLYLTHGYYPFFRGNEMIYFQQLNEVVGLVIDMDLPQAASILPSAKEQLKRLLGAISSTVPYAPNMQNLAALLHISDYRTLLKYLVLLEEAQLIQLLQSAAKGNKKLQKPEKIYLNNTNLTKAIGTIQTNIGTDRETFFLNQLRTVASVHYPEHGDFLVNHHYVFEIGGKQKNRHQLKALPNAYVVADDIEVGFGQKIPLWLFGFLY